MTKLSVDTFLEYLRKSELTNENQLNASLEKIRAQANNENISDADWIASELVKEGLITNWHVRQLMKRKYKGFYLRQYRILGHLGTGGMSTVYLAEHTLMQRRVAIKVLPKKRLANAVYLDRFIREAQAIASIIRILSGPTTSTVTRIFIIWSWSISRGTICVSLSKRRDRSPMRTR